MSIVVGHPYLIRTVVATILIRDLRGKAAYQAPVAFIAKNVSHVSEHLPLIIAHLKASNDRGLQ
jgi:hypothetical protein